MDEHLKKAIDTYVELIKQVIGLCTLIIGFVSALLRLIPSAQLEIWTQTYIALVAFILSILFGLLALGRVVGFLGANGTDANDSSLRGLVMVQQTTFIGGIVLLVWWLVGSIG